MQIQKCKSRERQIYIYIERDRETETARETERERERERERESETETETERKRFNEERALAGRSGAVKTRAVVLRGCHSHAWPGITRSRDSTTSCRYREKERKKERLFRVSLVSGGPEYTQASITHSKTKTSFSKSHQVHRRAPSCAVNAKAVNRITALSTQPDMQRAHLRVDDGVLVDAEEPVRITAAYVWLDLENALNLHQGLPRERTIRHTESANACVYSVS